jgi:hypothetical protein
MVELACVLCCILYGIAQSSICRSLGVILSVQRGLPRKPHIKTIYTTTPRKEIRRITNFKLYVNWNFIFNEI